MNLAKSFGRLAGVAAVVFASSVGTVAASDAAAGYPSRPITIVVPYPPGGPPDVIVRVLAGPLERSLGRPIVVDNRPGVSTTVGTRHAARATGDGYTLLAVEPTFVVAPHTLLRAGYDPIKDFKPVGITARTFHTFAVSPKLPVKSVADLLKLAKEKPNDIKVGHSGVGTPPYLSALSFVQATGASILLVPYRGTALVVGDVVGGHVSGVFTGPSTTAALAKEGKLRVLGITGPNRSKALPDVPTFRESGITMAGVDEGIWFGLVAPSATPDAIVTKLNAAVRDAVKDPQVIAKLGAVGIFAESAGPEEMGKQMAAEFAHWRDALAKAGVLPKE